MRVLSIRKKEKDFTEEFLNSVAKIKPSILDFHVFLKDEFIKRYSQFDHSGLINLLDPNTMYDEESFDEFHGNLAKEFEFLQGGGVSRLEVVESNGCYCSRTEGGEVYNFYNPVTHLSLSYRFTVTSKEFDVSKCFGPDEGNDSSAIHSKPLDDDIPF